MLVSIIVPVFNTHEYLDNCLYSLRNQTYSDIEIIIVNDGSTDNSALVCEKHLNEDNRVTIINKKNGGISSSRNEGIKNAHGDFICFVDSDDFVEKDFVERLLYEMDRNNADIVEFGFFEHKSQKCLIHKKRSCIISHLKAIEELLLKKRISGFVWNKMYKAAVIKDVRFDETIKFGEESPFLFLSFARSSKIIQIGDVLYHYIRRSNSLTGFSSFNHDKMTIFKGYDLMTAYDCNHVFNKLINYWSSSNALELLDSFIYTSSTEYNYVDNIYEYLGKASFMTMVTSGGIIIAIKWLLAYKFKRFYFFIMKKRYKK